ncbi:MAG: LemA family protein [Magnetococcales bacterium]|nr:LemA family protein [Magnetococcales bacterium]
MEFISLLSDHLNLIILLLAGFFGVRLFNRLVRLNNYCKNAFSQIDVQLKRRHDLIPNLVESAKAYLKHEQKTLEAVISARNRASSALKKSGSSPTSESMKGVMGAEAMLGQALGGLFAVMENYPDLKADQTMDRLMEELTATENRIAFARQAFNDAATDFNTQRETFPDLILVRLFNFKESPLWEISDDNERRSASVSFDR